MRDNWESVKEDIAGSMLDSFEVCAEWPDYSAFVDICDDHSVQPSVDLFCSCKQIACSMWNNLKVWSKKGDCIK